MGALAFSAVPAAAQPRDPAAADALFKEGRAAANRGDWPTACAKFEQSQDLDPAAGTLANLATCEEHLGRLTQSLAHARAAIAQLPRGDSRIPIVKKLAADLEKRIARLTIRVAADVPDGSRVVLDGTEIPAASLGGALPVDPGNHTLSLFAAGRRERRVASSEPSTSEAPLTTPASSGSGARVAGFVIGGLGVASLVVGGITGGMVIAKKQTVEQHCDTKKACDPQGLDAGSSGKTLATVSTITVAAGAALLATGVVIILVSGNKHPKATVGATATTSGGSVVFDGRF
jgi:hypothetical protein